MGCEITKKGRIRWIGARPSEIRTAEDRRLVTLHPHLLRDRVEVTKPMIMCGRGMNADPGECMVDGCRRPASHECDGCDLPICEGHANNRGNQTIQAESGFDSPGFRRFEYEDSYDLCPFCLFNGKASR